jgi:ferredoxin
VTRLQVDRERCVGSGTCEALAPDLFEVGDDGIVGLLRPPHSDGDEAAASDAVQGCPTGALSLLG